MTVGLTLMKPSKILQVQRRTFEVGTFEQVLELIRQLAKERHTGPITINMAQGGVRNVSIENQNLLSS